MAHLHIDYLVSGGLITNYYCTSRCRHCLYACSPNWPKIYIQPEQVRNHIDIMKGLGCYSLHIGGGEPFLNLDALKEAVQIINKENVGIEYIETNSSWVNNVEKTSVLLQEFQRSGVHTLLVSISPFHNEHIPFKKVKTLIEICQSLGIHVFPWIQAFYPELASLNEENTHTLEDFKKAYGNDYVKEIPQRYWIHYGGRAIDTFKDEFQLYNVHTILDQSTPCMELADTSHFHLDLFGSYIPGLCSGFGIHFKDLGAPLPENKYPIIHMLYNQGIKAFYEWAIHKGFKPEQAYLNKCHLCLAIRTYLVIDKNMDSKELKPKEFYTQL